jgi:chromosome segregation ATPase
MESKMADAKRSDEALKKIQDIKLRIKGHESKISQIEAEKRDRVKSLDQRIKQEQDQIRQYSSQIEILKRQI